MVLLTIVYFLAAWDEMTKHTPSQDPEMLKKGSIEMITSYVETLPLTMTVPEFVQILQKGEMFTKLMDIAEEMGSKKSDL